MIFVLPLSLELPYDNHTSVVIRLPLIFVFPLSLELLYGIPTPVSSVFSTIYHMLLVLPLSLELFELPFIISRNGNCVSSNMLEIDYVIRMAGCNYIQHQ